MKKYLRILLILSLVLTMLFSLNISASAVTSWSGGREVVRVWTNKTGSTPSITLKLDKGTYKYYTLTGKEKTGKAYGYYDITVKPVSTIDGGKTSYKQSSASIKDSSKKINLKKDTYYEIVITWNDWWALNRLGSGVKGLFKEWQSYPTWSVKSTKNCGNVK